jgi:hypothetical protein
MRPLAQRPLDGWRYPKEGGRPRAKTLGFASSRWALPQPPVRSLRSRWAQSRAGGCVSAASPQRRTANASESKRGIFNRQGPPAPTRLVPYLVRGSGRPRKTHWRVSLQARAGPSLSQTDGGNVMMRWLRCLVRDSAAEARARAGYQLVQEAVAKVFRENPPPRRQSPHATPLASVNVTSRGRALM